MQGDRSQSRRQFLTSRIDYIDSWLNVKNYARGGNNRIQGRIAANSEGKLSDKWIEDITDPNTSYWLGEEFTSEKRHDFDSEYWLTLTPMRSAYVTAGDDSMNYPALKYDGVHPAKLKLNDIEPGIRRSLNYPEQLVYVYGLDKMSSYGELYKMYWTEFFMRGNKAGHLTDLLLGYDGNSFTDPDVTWYNRSLNDISLIDMPLLKEANFSGLNITKSGGADLNLKASEKLENFRAVRTSNLNTVQFADGVALNTLYVPKSLTALNLIQANLLTNLIDEATPPSPTNVEEEKDGKTIRTVLPPKQGLYIDGLFGDEMETQMTTFNFDGGGLGFGSYKILKRVYDVSSADTASSKVYNFTMKDVNWCPYVQLTEGAVYDPEGAYFIDDRHYGLTSWVKDSELFDNLVLNGRLYVFTDPKDSEGNPLTVDINSDHHFVQMLVDLHDKQKYKDAVNSTLNPTISGIVYVNDTVEENYLYENLQAWYPDLTFFFSTVTPAYSARFIYRDENGIDNWVKFKGQTAITTPTLQKISQEDFNKGDITAFTSPFELYEPEKTHHKFIGWSTNPNATSGDKDLITPENWSNQSITKGVYDYTYYAIFEIDSYDVIFYNGDGKVLQSKKLPYGTENIPTPEEMPTSDDSNLDLYLTNSFVGYTNNLLTNELINFENERVLGKMEYWPIFEEVNVYNNVHPEYFAGRLIDESNPNLGVSLSLKQRVSGKITIPKTYEIGDKVYPVTTMDKTFASAPYGSANAKIYGQDLTHVFFEPGTSIKEFGEYCFYGYDAYTAIDNISKLKYVEFPETLEIIGKSSFRGCEYLDYSVVTQDPELYATAVIKGSNITEIGERAFQTAFPEKKLGEMFIGSSVQKIGQNAFLNIGYNIDRITIGTPQTKSDYIPGKAVVITSDNVSSVWLYTNNTSITESTLSIVFEGVTDFQIK